MIELPEFCRTDGLVVPVVPNEVAAWLERTDPDALEALRSLGGPAVTEVSYRTVPKLYLTSAFVERQPVDGGPTVGMACVVIVDTLPSVPPFRIVRVVSEDGRFLEPGDLPGDDRVRVLNSSYLSYLIFDTALAAVPVDDEAAARRVLPRLGEIDPWAFTSRFSRWPKRFAERVWCNVSVDRAEERDRIRQIALSSI